MSKGGKAHKRFRERLRSHYREIEKAAPKSSKRRKLDEAEFAVRKAELEARGLPPSKLPVLAPAPKKIYVVANDRQFFFPSGGRMRRS